MAIELVTLVAPSYQGLCEGCKGTEDVYAIRAYPNNNNEDDYIIHHDLCRECRKKIFNALLNSLTLPLLPHNDNDKE
jgi:hypothetical protein